jgi:hypothetical protein
MPFWDNGTWNNTYGGVPLWAWALMACLVLIIYLTISVIHATLRKPIGKEHCDEEQPKTEAEIALPKTHPPMTPEPAHSVASLVYNPSLPDPTMLQDEEDPPKQVASESVQGASSATIPK